MKLLLQILGIGLASLGLLLIVSKAFHQRVNRLFGKPIKDDQYLSEHQHYFLSRYYTGIQLFAAGALILFILFFSF